MNEKQVQEAFARVDNALAQGLNVNRPTHISLVNDMRLIQQCCTAYFSDLVATKELPEEPPEVRESNE